MMTREEVLDKILCSADATVGGGSASALAAAMAAGMCGMVARLSTGKNLRYPDAEYIGWAERLDALASYLVEGASQDAAAFAKISAAFKLPKNSEDEKRIRAHSIQQAGIAAAGAPLENARLAEQVGEICDTLMGNHNVNAESDLLIARHFLNVALYGLALNIEANLSLIKTAETREGFATAAAELRVKAGIAVTQ